MLADGLRHHGSDLDRTTRRKVRVVIAEERTDWSTGPGADVTARHGAQNSDENCTNVTGVVRVTPNKPRSTVPEAARSRPSRRRRRNPNAVAATSTAATTARPTNGEITPPTVPVFLPNR